ncbi:MAG: hypothetical protein LBS88_09275 [Tannerellaceae bacterium]|jgi:hypothetical protein|nr:hypothetical protein [Tannerellaceae bacterium]
MKHFKIILLGVVVLICTCNTRSYSQVTIGIDEEPSKGALLQLKELHVNSGDDGENSHKGFFLPRVQLSVRDKLYPMFGSASSPSGDYSSSTDIAAANKEHTGLIVYNIYESPNTVTNSNLIFTKGLYAWTGERWENLGVMTAENGLSIRNDTLRLGGPLTEAATNIVVDMNHELRISGLETQTSNSQSVVVDVNTGKLGMSAATPAKLAFFQSADETHDLVANGINSGSEVVVPWSAADQVTNNFLIFNDTENSFELEEDAQIEISAMVGYRGRGATTTSINIGTLGTSPTSTATPNNATVIIINATLQIKRAAGSGNWENYSSVRGVYVGTVNYYRNTLSIPPALVSGKKGDKIRLIIQRPSGLGGDHEDGTELGIVVPYGTQFSKSIKIIAQ